MPSRKRNNGKARKAKRSSTARPDDQLSRSMELLSLEGITRCYHACRDNIVAQDVSREFIEMFFREWTQSPAENAPSLVMALAITKVNLPDVWQDKQKLSAVRTYFVYHGTELLLRSSDVLFNKAALNLTHVITLIEGHVSDIDRYPDKKFMKNTDLWQGCERSLFQFYKSRIGCTCLDEKCAALTARKSTGLCAHCKIRKERSTLLLCSGCNRKQYCSKECQAAHWSNHKEDCRKHRMKLASLKEKGNVNDN